MDVDDGVRDPGQWRAGERVRREERREALTT